MSIFSCTTKLHKGRDIVGLFSLTPKSRTSQVLNVSWMNELIDEWINNQTPSLWSWSDITLSSCYLALSMSAQLNTTLYTILQIPQWGDTQLQQRHSTHWSKLMTFLCLYNTCSQAQCQEVERTFTQACPEFLPPVQPPGLIQMKHGEGSQSCHRFQSCGSLWSHKGESQWSLNEQSVSASDLKLYFS